MEEQNKKGKRSYSKALINKAIPFLNEEFNNHQPQSMVQLCKKFHKLIGIEYINYHDVKSQIGYNPLRKARKLVLDVLKEKGIQPIHSNKGYAYPVGTENPPEVLALYDMKVRQKKKKELEKNSHPHKSPFLIILKCQNHKDSNEPYDTYFPGLFSA